MCRDEVRGRDGERREWYQTDAVSIKSLEFLESDGRDGR
jgi:hypothetical protein